MAGKNNTDKEDTGKSAAGSQDSKTAETIETVGDLEACYPKLVSAVRDEVIVQVGNCTLDQVKKNMPDFYQRLVMEVQNKSGPNLNVPGFLLETDDPFAEGTLRTFQKMKGISGCRLPFVIPYKDKARASVDAARLKRNYEKSEVLKAEFKTVDIYIAFKGRLIIQVLEDYILRASGGCDPERVKAARRAMKNIK